MNVCLLTAVLLGVCTPVWDSKIDRSWQMTRKVKELPVGRDPWKAKYPL